MSMHNSMLCYHIPQLLFAGSKTLQTGSESSPWMIPFLPSSYFGLDPFIVGLHLYHLSQVLRGIVTFLHFSHLSCISYYPELFPPIPILTICHLIMHFYVDLR